jgi:hypothetical protein
MVCKHHCWAADSTGIKAKVEGEWNARKHGGSKRRLWRKIYIGIDEKNWKYVQSRQPAVALVMRLCSLIC